jgi:hypothetical protein
MSTICERCGGVTDDTDGGYPCPTCRDKEAVDATTDPEIINEFVLDLLDRWEGDEYQIFSEWGAGSTVDMDRAIHLRRARWAAIWAAHTTGKVSA